MNEHDIMFTIIAGTLLFLMMAIAIIWLVLFANRSYRRGIKWAEDNNPNKWTDEDAVRFIIDGRSGIIPGNISDDIWVDQKLIKKYLESIKK